MKNQWKNKPHYSVFQQSCYLMWWNDNKMLGKPIPSRWWGLQRLPASLQLGPRDLLCPELAQPSEAKIQTSLTVQMWGHFFQGHSHLSSWKMSLQIGAPFPPPPLPQTLNTAVRPAFCWLYGIFINCQFHHVLEVTCRFNLHGDRKWTSVGAMLLLGFLSCVSCTLSVEP